MRDLADTTGLDGQHFDLDGNSARKDQYDDLILPSPKIGADLKLPLRQALRRHQQFGPEQVAGRLFPVACVALEVTQRCNLDCSLCYLSDLAEATPDPSLDALLNRVERIHAQYGAHTNIQITGGDPTLRPVGDLEVLVTRIRELGMRSALFTNGIRAKRPLLARLVQAGLNDVCFHVDLTQKREGYDTEGQLNTMRQDYLDRARGLGLRVNFNVTVFEGNLTEIGPLVRWFVAHAADINLASFQMQAETGRGVLGARDTRITQTGLEHVIHNATNGAANFDVFRIGHEDCNRHASVLAAGGRTTPLYADAGYFRTLFDALSDREGDWNSDLGMALRALRTTLRDPRLWPGALRAIRHAFGPLLPALMRGHRPHRLSFFIHNFMSADQIERTRCETCVFMVMTDRGPISMCAHNAARDHHVLPELSSTDRARLQTALAFKQLKGRLRQTTKARKAAS